MNLVLTYPHTVFFKIHFNIFLPSTPKFANTRLEKLFPNGESRNLSSSNIIRVYIKKHDAGWTSRTHGTQAEYVHIFGGKSEGETPGRGLHSSASGYTPLAGFYKRDHASSVSIKGREFHKHLSDSQNLSVGSAA
jgi:hypothetical protein